MVTRSPSKKAVRLGNGEGKKGGATNEGVPDRASGEKRKKGNLLLNA